MNLKYNLCWIIITLSCCINTACQGESDRLYYFSDAPASQWEDAFPLGNGRLGMMPFGSIEEEEISLNEISVWSGSEQNTINPETKPAIEEMRKLLFNGQNDLAEAIAMEKLVCKGVGSNKAHAAESPYGCFQTMGTLRFKYDYQGEGEVTNYYRELDITNAINTTSFTKDGVKYRRESFTSFSGSDVGVIRLTASKKGALNFTVELDRLERATTSVEGGDLVLKGRLTDGVDLDVDRGMRIGTQVRVLLPKGGELLSEDNTLRVESADEAIVLVAMGTDFFEDNFLAAMPQMLDRAAAVDYEVERISHIEAYQKLFGRATLSLSSKSATEDRSKLPINKRLLEASKDTNDPELAVLYFQFGRYLLISSTREGYLPPNLQGLWCDNDKIQTPWNGDYHLNINFQMNHWPAEVTNLAELHRPLIEWTKQQVASGKKTAKGFYGARGWTTHTLGNLWEFTALSENPLWGASSTCGAWLCEHLYHHYLYNPDDEYLAEIWPIMRDASLFFVDVLVEDPRYGYLVTAPTVSPENWFLMDNGSKVRLCSGATMDIQIIRELFTNTIAASEKLQVYKGLREKLTLLLDRLKPTQIGEDGRIMEWAEAYTEADSAHRHVSHLYGLYPSNEISVNETPELAAAARKTLEMRGDGGTGWSIGWKINFWARLHDGDRAHSILYTRLLKPSINYDTKKWQGGGSYPNMFCAHAPFQIDGNFGGCAGIIEMLLQSQTGVIELLPALPSAWDEGSFSGMRVRGGAEIDVAWSDGKLTNATLNATHDGLFKLRLPSNVETFKVLLNGRRIDLELEDSLVAQQLVAGDKLVIVSK